MNEQGHFLSDILFSSPPDIQSIWLLMGGSFSRQENLTITTARQINALTCKRPIVRRSLQSAWDLAFLWGSHEPEHHQAMPHQVLIALVTAAWYWAWRREAGIFALAWGGLLRISEIYGAYREDLVLPEEVNRMVSFALL